MQKGKKIRQKYDFAVIHYMWGLNGGTYDAIEYAYTLSQLGSTKLVIFIKNPNAVNTNTINEAINKKYILDSIPFDIEYKKSIISIDLNDYKSILFIDSSCIEQIPLYKAKKYFIYADYIPDSFRILKRVCKLNNVIIMNEMPFYPSPVNYMFKHAFNIFKHYDYLENNTLYSIKWVNNRPQRINRFIHHTEFMNNKDNKIIKFDWPLNDFNQKFNRYVYYNKNYFDPRPRIFHECAHYGRNIDNIIRIVEKENFDGAYIKISKLKDGDITERILTINDDLIQMMANA